MTNAEGGETVLVAGHADMAGTPLRPDHLLQIGSISKSFAVICALQLEAEGALSLDDPLTTHLPWFRVGGGHGTITLRHLIMHRSGLPMGSDPGPSSLGLVAELAAVETEWEPGERFWYSNIGYDALGFALEAAGGVPFPELVSRRVLGPLGMRSSVAHIAAAGRSRLADPHDGLHPDRPWHPAFGLVTAPFAPSEGASGSIVSTAGDMAGYVRHLLARGPTGFDRMTDGVPDDEGEPYGLGLRISQRRGHTVVGHSGGMVGYVAQMLCDMEAGVGAIALSNGPSERPRSPTTHSTWRGPRSSGLRSPTRPPTRRRIWVTEQAGTGRSRSTPTGIHAFGRDGSLHKLATDLYATDHPGLCHSYIRYGRSAAGGIDHLVTGDDWHPGEGYAGPDEFPHPAEWTAYPGLYRSHNPWLPALRITLCRGELALEQSSYGRMRLESQPGGGFAVTTPEGRLPERLRFSMLVGGLAQRVETGGCVLYRAARS